MFYRRKLILALLEVYGGSLEKIALQKLLFILTRRQETPNYDFVPYLYGCYSFSLHADLVAMIRHNHLVDDSGHYRKNDNLSYTEMLSKSDQRALKITRDSFSNVSADLMKYTYINYGYFAINSVKAKEILTNQEYRIVRKQKPTSTQTVLYTIGYEGASLESYLNKLVKNDIRVLVDVRNNALSMKFGFSKTQLSTFCKNLGIQYLHIPQVGIQSKLRRQLNSQNDYDKLFKKYRQNTLKNTSSHQQQILNLLITKKRIALTCFEANVCQCHRKSLAEAITELPDWKFDLKHI